MTSRPRDNRASLVAVTAAFVIAPPVLYADRPHGSASGHLISLPGSGGIAPRLHTGTRVDAVLADHAMPGLSLHEASGNVHGLVCVGNRARDAAGQTMGVVAGKRGGLAPGFIPGQYIGVEASDRRVAEAAPGDPVAIETLGRGLQLSDFPDVAVLNCSPRTLDALTVSDREGSLHVPVNSVVPGVSAGPGLGSDPWIGDLEIDGRIPEGLHFGDIVAFDGIDSRVSRFLRTGCVSIGVVSHGPSPVAGHGVGITILLSGPAAVLRAVRSRDAGLAPSLRRWSDAEESEWS
jgi:hypothetical protein